MLIGYGISIYYHIGVGSNVVCSTGLGSARASVSGTDDKRCPRFLYAIEKLTITSVEGACGDYIIVIYMARGRNSGGINRRSNKSSGGSKTWIFILVAIVLLCGIGYGVYRIITPPHYQFTRADLDKYIETVASHEASDKLGDGAAVYVDMSDGMNCAYASAESKVLLQSIVNKLAANDAIQFYGLADMTISDIDMDHTHLFNYMMNTQSYQKQKAPIEKTLGLILERNQPALLMSDFEEYKGVGIEKAAYAKRYFIEWLAKGFNITFYKWDFVERGKNKYMFLAVFDDNINRLNNLVANAIATSGQSIERYILASKQFSYPTASNYISLKQGGNYHNALGKDIVTAVLEDGSKEAYVSYTQPLATANGVGPFASLDNLAGNFSEYYPVGVKWNEALANSKALSENGVPERDEFKHLLSNLYINLKAQDGFDIEELEVRTFDMQTSMMEKSAMSADSIDVAQILAVSNPEVNEFLSCDLDDDDLPEGWYMVSVDFHKKFDGTFASNTDPSHLFRANIVIAEAKPEIEKACEFFAWDGNQSLANSVVEALTAPTSNPEGRVLYTYYLKTLTE